MAEPGKKPLRLSRRMVGIVTLSALVLVFVALWGGKIGRYEVISESMIPVLRKGDCVLVDQRGYLLPRRGDIVVFPDPGDEELITKRVIGLPNERVEVTEDAVLVDGQRVKVAGWAPPVWRGAAVKTTVGPDQVFVLGDNRKNSQDSLYFGAVPVESIRGRIFLIYWPPGRARRLDGLATISAKERN